MKPNILAIDDTKEILKLLHDVFTAQGIIMRCITTPAIALQAVQQDPPDLILLDAMMPEMNGFEVCQRLKTDERTCDVPVIFMSALTDPFNKVQAFQAGAVDYVIKPFDSLEELTARVQAHLTIQLQRKQLRAQQEQMIVQAKLASLGELTAGIAHELKNPLNFICNFSQAVLDLTNDLHTELAKPQPDPQELRYIVSTLPDLASKIHVHGDRATRIIQNMLQHSRGEHGSRTPTNLNRLVKEYVALTYHSQRLNKFHPVITEHYDPALDAQEIPVIAHDLSRVIINLCSNAFDALRERTAAHTSGYQPTLTVTTCDQGETVQVLIRDNGVGIPEAIRAKIFEPFFTTKPPGEGTGLGLSLAYDIVVQEHQGQLLVTSQEGEFTEFTIILLKE